MLVEQSRTFYFFLVKKKQHKRNKNNTPLRLPFNISLKIIK